MTGPVASRFDALAHNEERWRGYLERIRAKDSHSLAQLYDETSSILYGLALRMLTDPAEAEKVILKVYEQVWTTDAFDTVHGGVLAYLTALTRGCAVDRMRTGALASAPREGSGAPGISCAGNISESESAFQTVNTFERERKLVQRALQMLPSEQRVAVELAFFGGLTETELAQALEAPVATVKRRIRLGMGKLREVLESVASIEKSA
jgi:RNA polymerase sigma-70 factor (ECF subfamily)